MGLRISEGAMLTLGRGLQKPVSAYSIEWTFGLKKLGNGVLRCTDNLEKLGMNSTQ